VIGLPPPSRAKIRQLGRLVELLAAVGIVAVGALLVERLPPMSGSVVAIGVVALVAAVLVAAGNRLTTWVNRPPCVVSRDGEPRWWCCRCADRFVVHGPIPLRKTRCTCGHARCSADHHSP
jgi:hypothetical protein